jgi:hypothetical protein
MALVAVHYNEWEIFRKQDRQKEWSTWLHSLLRITEVRKGNMILKKSEKIAEQSVMLL